MSTSNPPLTESVRGGKKLTPFVLRRGRCGQTKKKQKQAKKGKPCFFAQPTTRIVHRLISRWAFPCCRLVQTRRLLSHTSRAVARLPTPVGRSPLHAPMSPRWTLGTPYNAHGRRASHPGNVVSTPTTPTTSCPHNPLHMTPTGCAPLTGGNRSYPIISWVGH